MRKKNSSKKSVYRFFVLAVLQFLGYAGIIRQHIVFFPGRPIEGDEAFAFGFLCLSLSLFLIILEQDLIKRRILKT